MPNSTARPPQGPFAGSRCVTGPGHQWGEATIRRVNEDGTFKVELDIKSMLILKYWQGVTREEITFDDDLHWPAMFAKFSSNRTTLTKTDFAAALELLGYKLEPEVTNQIWDQHCHHLFKVDGDALNTLALDPPSSYRLFLNLGLPLKVIHQKLNSEQPKEYFKLYWNQTRMAGRNPAELPRDVRLTDTVQALGLEESQEDKNTTAFLEEFEKENSLSLPENFKRILGRTGASTAIDACHPNNPSLLKLVKRDWSLERGKKAEGLLGDNALLFMVPHQGDHDWWLVFDNGQTDGTVYVRWYSDDGQKWLLTAPSFAFFLWDLAQTGLVWYQDTQYEGGKPVLKTDIGLVPK
ncbi:hypothetical protein KIH39_14770 [Telmatocola sphagniphila]|uniref:Knr4/Smi1-like domain-containing protein n=1 Tax=Telmatocola sphagniphila TaxID=1123043 RepID=A0A8E6B1J5_9BACT|nr:hypothetical protein [Telmatocola sphagniphila]QVL30118.1 hypothetical protein KIH39_14770 [Telmatocola sphagniphila]